MRRLRQPRDFEALLKLPAVARSTHFVLHRQRVTGVGKPGCAEQAHRVRASALVSKRWVKRAVSRNLIRRQLDAVLQRFRLDLEPHLYLVRMIKPLQSDLFLSAASDRLRHQVRLEFEQLFDEANRQTP